MIDHSSCRLTGAAAFTGVGAYAMYQGRRQGAFQKARPTGGARGSGVTIALGIGESLPQGSLLLIAAMALRLSWG